MEVRLVQSLCKRFFSYLIRLPSVATFNLPSRKRGWGCVTTNLHTPLSPLFRGESQKFEISKHQAIDPLFPLFASGELRGVIGLNLYWAKVLFLLIIPFLNCGMWSAECGMPKSETQNLSSTQIGDPKSKISRDGAIKIFTNANENYLQAAKCIAAKNNQEADQKLKEAATQYETILANGFEHGQIYYNLGNTYYRRGELGKSVLNYRKAQRLMPRNADLDANLKLVKNSIEDKELPNEVPVVLRRIFFWFFLLNGKELIVAAVSLYVVFMTLVFFLIILKYGWLKRLMIGFSAGLFIAVVSLGIKIYSEQGVSRGVITTTKCQVRYGPGEEYEPKFEIHNGAECLIKGEKDDWYNVYVYVGVKQEAGSKPGAEEKVGKDVRKGWLQKKEVGVI